MGVTDPVFIIGCIRSGTTVFHRTLLRAMPDAVEFDEHDFEMRSFWRMRSPLIPAACGTQRAVSAWTKIGSAVTWGRLRRPTSRYCAEHHRRESDQWVRS